MNTEQDRPTDRPTDENKDLIMELGVMDDMKFRFRSQKALLTYRTHINKEHLLMFLTGVNQNTT